MKHYVIKVGKEYVHTSSPPWILKFLPTGAFRFTKEEVDSKMNAVKAYYPTRSITKHEVKTHSEIDG